MITENKIKTAQGGDDYGSMQEVIYRRYSRVLKEKLPFPDLIVIDGGKGQVGAAQDVLHNQLGLDIPVAGLVKTINIKPASYCLAMICSRFSSNEIQSNSFCCKESKMKFIGLPLLSTDNCAARTVSLQDWMKFLV